MIQGGSPIDNEAPWPSFGGDLQNTGRVTARKAQFRPKLRVLSVSDNTFHFLVIGDAFETYQIEHSSDLRQWNPLVFGGIKTNFRGRADFKADKASDTRHEFFRVRN